MGIGNSSREDQNELPVPQGGEEPKKVGIFCPGEQGKSLSLTKGKFTVYQQIRFFYARIEKENRYFLLSTIIHNIISYFELLKTLYLKQNNLPKDEIYQRMKSLKIEHKSLYEVNDVKDYFKLMNDIWRDEKVKNFFWENRLKFPQAIVYLFDNSNFYLYDSYEFTEKDVLSMRIKSIGIKGEMISYKSHPLKIICGAGQRNERKKWANHNVSYIIWVFSLIDWVLTCYEDETINRMKESFDCYTRYIHDEFFKPQKIFLYLNMYDVYSEIEEHYSTFKTIFPDYKGKEDSQEILLYIIDRLYNLTPDPEEKLSIFITQANDREIMNDVLDQTLRIIVKDDYKIKGKKYYLPQNCPRHYKMKKDENCRRMKNRFSDMSFRYL